MFIALLLPAFASVALLSSPSAVDTLTACNNTRVHIRFSADSPHGFTLPPGQMAPVTTEEFNGWIDFGQIGRRYSLTPAERKLLNSADYTLVQLEADGSISLYTASACPAAGADQPAGFPLRPVEITDLT